MGSRDLSKSVRLGIVTGMSNYQPAVEPPALYKLAAECRIAVEAPLFMSVPWRRLPIPKGDGHPVLLIPGFMTSDATMRPLARELRKLGYRALTWGEGFNLGTKPELIDRLIEKLESLRAETGMQVSLIGWSLGGIISRKLAVKRPDLIRRVMMLGSPIHGTAGSTRVGALMAMIEKTRKTTIIQRRGIPSRPAPCKVPVVSLFNQFDAIANWKNCFETESPNAENIHVTASHFGFGVNPAVMQVLTDRLAQPRSGFHPYHAPGFAHAFIQPMAIAG